MALFERGIVRLIQSATVRDKLGAIPTMPPRVTNPRFSHLFWTRQDISYSAEQSFIRCCRYVWCVSRNATVDLAQDVITSRSILIPVHPMWMNLI